jgi:AcrR family transcriptional regulator
MRQVRKVVESSDRREEVARATWRVIARDGLDRASMRAIAHELGCTTGVLTHHFRDKNALLEFALRAIVERLNEGKSPDLEKSGGLEDVRALLTSYLPTSPDARTWWRVWLSFTVTALANETQAAEHAQLYADLRRFWTDVFTGLRQRGLVLKDIDPAIEAESLLCFVDGIGVQALISPRSLTAKRQMQLVENYLSRLRPAR